MAPKTTADRSAKQQAAKQPLRSPEDIQRWFRANGMSISGWAKERGFSPSLTHSVVMGERKCLRGQSHRIAVALGLKEKDDFEFDDGGPKL